MTKTIEDIIIQLLRDNHYCRSFRIIKTIALTQQEKETIARKTNRVIAPTFEFIFWCWLDEGNSVPTFLFGQFYIFDSTIVWGYRHYQYQNWAKKAYNRGWFDREDIRKTMIEYVSSEV